MKGSLRSQHGKYYAVFRETKNGNPIWHPLGITDKRGNRRIAEQAMAKMVAEFLDSPRQFIKISFVSYIQKWLCIIKNHVDDITYQGYEQYATKHIIPYFEPLGIQLQDVKIADIERYYAYKAIGGRLDGKPGGLSARTIKLHGTVLSLVFQQAIHDGLVKSNPCEYAKLPRNAKPSENKAGFYTVAQCKRLLDNTTGSPLHDMIYLSILYGLRRSELMGLRWQDVDFDNRTIAISHTVVVNKTVVTKDKTKNKASRRQYPLLDDVEQILLGIRQQQEKNREVYGESYIQSDYIFTKMDGSCYYPSYPTQQLKKVLRKVNLPEIRWHDLRHSCASILIEKGWGMKDISDWLGHSNIGTTMNIYGHISMAHKQELGHTLHGLLDNGM